MLSIVALAQIALRDATALAFDMVRVLRDLLAAENYALSAKSSVEA